MGSRRRGNNLSVQDGFWNSATSAASLCLLLLVAAFLAATSLHAQNTIRPIRLSVDLTESPRRIFHAHLTVPAVAGPMTLLYPKWIPGEHAPDGPIADLVGLTISVGGKALPWRRDDVDVYAFHFDVPAGADTIDAAYDYLAPAEAEGFSAGPSADPAIAVLEWNLVVLYPSGTPADSLTYQASVRLPAGWKFASALPLDTQHENQIDFQSVSLSTLIDSPVLAGKYFRIITLAPEIPQAHHLNIAADSAAALEISSKQIVAYSRLVREESALFGARHYDHYDFLLSLSDAFDPNGLEHHQSSDDRAPERLFLNPDQTQDFNSLLSHEFTHSWNGKYRRPAGLITPDFQQPMKDDLLWIYEGLTEYIGEMISARAGLRTAEDYREELAMTAATLDHLPGRAWRPLADTAVSAPFLYAVNSRNWESWRRSLDFYSEGWMVWLDADMLIRRESHGKKSLDDFCRLFYGAPNTAPKVVPYTLDNVTAALNQTLPYDWASFFRSRVDEITLHPPMGGIENAGWHLVYNETPNQTIRASESVDNMLDLTFSLGIRVQAEGDKDGRLADVIPGMPAALAGLSPGMRLVAVNGRSYSITALADAIHDAQSNSKPIEITADNAGVHSNFEVQYHQGQQFPHLERNAALPDLLTPSLLPLTANEPAKQPATPSQ